MMCLGKTGLLMSPVSKLIATCGQFFPFTVSPVAVSVRIFMNKGQFGFQIEIVCWCNCVLFCFPVTGFVITNCLWLSQRWAVMST